MAMTRDQESVQKLQRLFSQWNPDGKCQFHSQDTCNYNEQGKLSILHLCQLGLKQVPFEIWQFSALQKLFLSDNQLAILPKEVGNLTTLQFLYLYGNQLSTLPKELWSLTALQRLELGQNQLAILPKEVGNLTALQYLYLYKNRLTTLPKEVGNLTALQYLYLYNNQLTTLPKEVGNLTALQYLYLYKNQLTTLPKEIGSLIKLQHLDLHDNQLTTLPKEIRSLPTLQYLKLDNNPWQTPPPHIIAQGIPAILDYLRTNTLDIYLASKPLPSQHQSMHPITVFYLYANADKGFREELEKHMSSLRSQRLIADRHDGHIPAGADQEQTERGYLDAAQIILLLISPDFMASEYAELERVMQRYATGETHVVPILLRPVDWTGMPFASLPHLPSTGEPITRWLNRDDAFLNIVQGLRLLIQEILSTRSEEVQKNLQALHTQINTFRDPYIEIERSLESLPEEQANLTEQRDTIEKEIAALQNRLQKIQQQVTALSERQASYERERQNIQQQALELRNRQNTLEQEAQTLLKQIEQAKHR